MQRLLVCVTASIALHASALIADAVVVVPARHATSNHPMFRANLVPAASASSWTGLAATQAPLGERSTSAQVPRVEVANSMRPQSQHASAYASDNEGGVEAEIARWYTADELDVRAEPLTAPQLTYPDNLAHARIAGRVRLALFVDEQGWVRETQVITSQPRLVFDNAAVQAWRNVRFSPALRGTRTVKSTKVLDVEFRPD